MPSCAVKLFAMKVVKNIFCQGSIKKDIFGHNRVYIKLEEVFYVI